MGVHSIGTIKIAAIKFPIHTRYGFMAASWLHGIAIGSPFRTYFNILEISSMSFLSFSLFIAFFHFSKTRRPRKTGAPFRLLPARISQFNKRKIIRRKPDCRILHERFNRKIGFFGRVKFIVLLCEVEEPPNLTIVELRFFPILSLLPLPPS